MLIETISKETGQDADTIHNFLKTKFLKEIVELKGRKYTIIKSTSQLSKAEFQEYIYKCKQWAFDELNIVIPEPDEIEI